MTIEVTKTKIFLNGEIWNKVYKKQDIGQQILNLLYYRNREGKNNYQLLINGKDETEDFKKQVKEKYNDIPNQDLRNNFFKYSNIEL